MMDTGRPWPHDLDAEKALIGSIILDPWRYRELSERITAESFHDPANAAIFECAGHLSEMATLDMLSLSDDLERSGQLESCGGRAYLSELMDATPTSVNASRYAHIVSEHAARRAAIKIAMELQEQAFNGAETSAYVDTCMEALNGLQHASDATTGRFESMADLMPGVVEYVQALQDDDATVLGITTGYPDIDRYMRMRPGEMIVLAARPSIGKSALMFNMARAQSRTGLPVGIFSYEMTAQSLARRALFAEAGINAQEIQNGVLSPGAWGELIAKSQELAAAPVYIDERKGNMYQLRARARRMVQRHGVRAIYIDYLQLIPETPQSKQRNRENAVALLSSGIKSLAQELDIPVVVLAQLNRDAESQKKARETVQSTRPRLSHLRESGAIEQDADVVLLLYRPEVDDTNPEKQNLVELIIAKQRNGPTDTVRLTFRKNELRFENFSAYPAGQIAGPPRENDDYDDAAF